MNETRKNLNRDGNLNLFDKNFSIEIFHGKFYLPCEVENLIQIISLEQLKMELKRYYDYQRLK